MKKHKPTIPDELRVYFWDCDPGALDPGIHKRFITERILVYGNSRALRRLRHTRSSAVNKVFRKEHSPQSNAENHREKQEKHP
jgi:hypothetical protein